MGTAGDGAFFHYCRHLSYTEIHIHYWEFIERFRKQITVSDLIIEGLPEILRDASVPVTGKNRRRLEFFHYNPCAFSVSPLIGKIIWRVTAPQRKPKSEEGQVQHDKLRVFMEREKASSEQRKRIISKYFIDKIIHISYNSSCGEI